MEVQCECGNFRAKLRAFPSGTPGRLVCYCDDCQKYLRHLNRTDLLDEYGGTEVIPAYPADVEVLCGMEHLKCVRLYPGGTYRFFTACCNTPIANSRPGAPWMGFLRCVYPKEESAQGIEQVLGPVRSRIMGQFALKTPPVGTPKKFDLKAIFTVIPFILKGKLGAKAWPSPFFAEDGVSTMVETHVLSEAERQGLLNQ